MWSRSGRTDRAGGRLVDAIADRVRATRERANGTHAVSDRVYRGSAQFCALSRSGANAVSDRVYNSAAGFTLLEALAALTILAAGIGALAGLTGQNVATTLYAERRVALVAALRKAYVAMPARDAIREAQHGDVNGFSWRLDALPLLGPAGPWTPTAIKLQVGNGSGEAIEVDAVILRKAGAK